MQTTKTKTITLKGIITEDFINYKKPSMVLEFPTCSWKCESECGMQVCQNSALALEPNKEIHITYIIERYKNNPITHAIICAGLEPFDSYDQLIEFIKTLRHEGCMDDVVIYTGYYKDEISEQIKELSNFVNIIIKYGRYIPNTEGRYDEILKIQLASNNQYAERIS